MTIGYPSSIARPTNEYYDRTPTTVVAAYEGTPSAAGDTQRWLYTVPAAKLALLEFLYVRIYRTVTATGSGDVQTIVLITPNGGALTTVIRGVLTSPTAGNQNVIQQTLNALLEAGDSIEYHTSDLSSGGTLQYTSALKLTQFSA